MTNTMRTNNKFSKKHENLVPSFSRIFISSWNYIRLLVENEEREREIEREEMEWNICWLARWHDFYRNRGDAFERKRVTLTTHWSDWMYAKQRDDKLHANLSPKRWNIGVDRLYNAAYPRNIGQKNSSPLKIKRVKFVKILSSNSPSFFSARQIHARLSLSLFLTNHLRARTHYVRFFSGSTISEGEGGEGGSFPRKERSADSRKNLDERGENMGHCSRAGFRRFSKWGIAEKARNPLFV